MQKQFLRSQNILKFIHDSLKFWNIWENMKGIRNTGLNLKTIHTSDLRYTENAESSSL